MKRGAFTLVELIVVITIISILGTIGFISLQGYSSEARDSKRISDINNINKKISLEVTKGTPISELVTVTNTGIVTINSQSGTRNQGVVNFTKLKENRDDFTDNGIDYPISYSIGGTGTGRYNFLQLATIKESTNQAVLAGNYYKIQYLDSESIMLNGNGQIVTDDGNVLPYNSYILDYLYKNIYSGFSLRLLHKDYNGYAIQVLRQNDLNTKNIGFDIDGNLDLFSINNFCINTSCFVKIWYDQIGNNNATLSNISNLPKIVDNGIIYKKNNLPIVIFDGFDDYLDSSISLLPSKNLFINHVAFLNSGNSRNTFSRVISAGTNGVASWSTSGHITTTRNNGTLKFGAENSDAGYSLNTGTPINFTYGTPFIFTFEANQSNHIATSNLPNPVYNFLPLSNPDTWNFNNVRIGHENSNAGNTYLSGGIFEIVIGNSIDNYSLQSSQKFFYKID